MWDETQYFSTKNQFFFQNELIYFSQLRIKCMELNWFTADLFRMFHEAEMIKMFKWNPPMASKIHEKLI